MNTDEIKNLAKLARVSVTDDEAIKLGKDFENILKYIDQLSDINTDDVEPFNGPVINQFRDDVANLPDDTTHDLVVNNFPDTQDGFLKVPKIL
jgi:aspartyl-tRNA(Asn)/glutamyl-tRNA(Gln) amidotransferase subunit C